MRNLSRSFPFLYRYLSSGFPILSFFALPLVLYCLLYYLPRRVILYPTTNLLHSSCVNYMWCSWLAPIDSQDPTSDHHCYLVCISVSCDGSLVKFSRRVPIHCKRKCLVQCPMRNDYRAQSKQSDDGKSFAA